jgi:hypothetical protein
MLVITLSHILITKQATGIAIEKLKISNKKNTVFEGRSQFHPENILYLNDSCLKRLTSEILHEYPDKYSSN